LSIGGKEFEDLAPATTGWRTMGEVYQTKTEATDGINVFELAVPAGTVIRYTLSTNPIPQQVTLTDAANEVFIGGLSTNPTHSYLRVYTARTIEIELADGAGAHGVTVTGVAPDARDLKVADGKAVTVLGATFKIVNTDEEKFAYEVNDGLEVVDAAEGIYKVIGNAVVTIMGDDRPPIDRNDEGFFEIPDENLTVCDALEALGGVSVETDLDEGMKVTFEDGTEYTLTEDDIYDLEVIIEEVSSVTDDLDVLIANILAFFGLTP
jgi:hypothetical protein